MSTLNVSQNSFVNLNAFSIRGLPVGISITDTSGATWTLAKSTATVDGIAVQGVNEDPSLRWLLDIGTSGDMGVQYYAALARAFTGVTDRNLAFFGDDFVSRGNLIAPQAASGTGAVTPGGSIPGAGIISCVGPTSGAGVSYCSSAGSGLIVTPNLKTKRWFIVTRFANTSAAGPDSHTRINIATYNGRILGAGIDGAFSASKYCFFTQASTYDGTVLSAVDQPALGTYSYVWFGSDGTNVKGAFADTTGTHETPVQIDTVANQTNNGGTFQFGVLPSGSTVKQDKAEFDLVYCWFER
jgi:hypothetical protein